jgi:hypothetical protein
MEVRPHSNAGAQPIPYYRVTMPQPVAMLASTRALPAAEAATDRARLAWPLSIAVPVTVTTPPLTVTLRRAPRSAGSDESAETTASRSARSEADTEEPTVADVVESSTVRPGATTTAPGTTTPDPIVVLLVVPVTVPCGLVVMTSGVVVARLVPFTEPLTEPLNALLVELLVAVELVELVGELLVVVLADGEVVVLPDSEVVEPVEGEVVALVDGEVVELVDGDVVVAEDLVVGFVLDMLVEPEDGVVACVLDVVEPDVVGCGLLMVCANAVDVSASAVKSERLRNLMESLLIIHRGELFIVRGRSTRARLHGPSRPAPRAVGRWPALKVDARCQRADYFFESRSFKSAKGLCVATLCCVEAGVLPCPVAASSCFWCSLSWQYTQSSSQLLPSGGLLAWLWSRW